MLAKIDYQKNVYLERNKKTTIKFAENLELTYYGNQYGTNYRITDVKGDFEITKISIIFCNGLNWDNTYDKEKNCFTSHSESVSATYFIIANMKEINFELQIPSTRFLTVNRFLKKKFVLSCNDALKFTYYVKKIKATAKEGNDIEILIENPYDIQIQGKKGDFKIEKCSSDETILTLSFGFSPEDSDKSAIAVDENGFGDIPQNDSSGPASNGILESTQQSSIDESRPESVIPAELPSLATTVLRQIHSNNRYSDVYFITFEGEKIPSHRNILAEFSNVFVQIFDETFELPVQIPAEDFNAETIHSALNYFCDKSDAINGKEMDVFKFAVKFGIQLLIDACCTFFEESVSPSNVCEYIQIAYLHKFDALKQKCLKLLVEKKKEIDTAKIFKLPHNIVVDAFCF